MIVILDTGPLVAYLDRGDQHHDWAITRFREIDADYLTCEPVMCEADHLLSRSALPSQALLEMVRLGALSLQFALSQSVAGIQKLQSSYRDVPMSLADACLVKMAEMYPDSRIMTLDSDFRLYRKHRRDAIPLIIPDSL